MCFFMVEVMKTLQKENVEFKKKIAKADMDTNRNKRSNELNELAEKYREAVWRTLHSAKLA